MCSLDHIYNPLQIQKVCKSPQKATHFVKYTASKLNIFVSHLNTQNKDWTFDYLQLKFELINRFYNRNKKDLILVLNPNP